MILIKFNTTKDSVAERTKTTNFEGGEAYDPEDPELALYKNTINNLLEDKFYQEDREQLNDLVEKFEAAAEHNPEFPLQLAVHARNEMGLRDVSQMLLVLSAEHSDTKQYVADYASNIMVRTDEPCTVVAMYDELFDGSLPKPLRKGIEDALHQWDKYQFDKYDNTNREVNIRDVINRVHPKPRDELREEIFERLMRGDLEKYPDVEPLDEAQDSTWESVISEKGNNAEAWREVLPRMGIMAKLRNTRNMMEAGVPTDTIYTEDDLDSVRHSRMFPFRIYQSYKAVKDAGYSDKHFEEWTSKAIDTSTENLPDRLENTLAVADTSGSMTWAEISGHSTMTPMEIASLFTAAVGRKGADTGAFANSFEFVDAHYSTPTLELQDKVSNAGPGGGTKGHKVIRTLVNQEKKYDRVILFTDEQMWDGSLRKEWNKYKREVAPEAKLYTIDLASYGDLSMPENHDDVYRISGWTEKVIDFIEYAEDENQILEEIKNVEA